MYMSSLCVASPTSTALCSYDCSEVGLQCERHLNPGGNGKPIGPLKSSPSVNSPLCKQECMQHCWHGQGWSILSHLWFLNCVECDLASMHVHIPQAQGCQHLVCNSAFTLPKDGAGGLGLTGGTGSTGLTRGTGEGLAM